MKTSGAKLYPGLLVPLTGLSSRRIFFLAALTAVAIGVAAEFVGLALAMALPIVAVVLICAVCNYKLALWISAFILPLASTNLIPSKILGVSGLSPLNIIVAISFLALLIHRPLNDTRFVTPRWPPIFFIFGFMFLAGGIHGAFYATSIPSYFREMNIVTASSASTYLVESLLKPVEMLFISYVFSIAVRNSPSPHIFLVALFLSAAFIACAVLRVAISSPLSLVELSSQEHRGYLSDLGMHANELGLLLNMATALALFCLPGLRNVSAKCVLGILIVILALAVTLTFSRGAYLGLLVVVIYFLCVHRRIKIAALFILVLVAGAVLTPSTVSERNARGLESQDPNTLSSGRINEIWLPLFPEITKSPVIGNGLGSILWSDAAQERAILPVGHPHSAYLGALMDFGFVGSFIILVFFVHMWRFFRALSRSVEVARWRGFFCGASACILLLLVQGLTDDSFVPTRTQPFLWLAYGCAVALSRARIKRR
jgi:hypothetical protein